VNLPIRPPYCASDQITEIISEAAHLEDSFQLSPNVLCGRFLWQSTTTGNRINTPSLPVPYLLFCELQLVLEKIKTHNKAHNKVDNSYLNIQ